MKAAILLFWFFMKDIQQPLKMQTADCHHGDGFVHLQGPPRGGIGIGPFFRSRISRIPNYILECPRWRIQVLQTSTNKSANISEELIWIHTYVYIYNIYICICMYVYICRYVYMYIYICIHRYMMFLLTGPIGLPWEVSRAQIRLDCLTNISV